MRIIALTYDPLAEYGFTENVQGLQPLAFNLLSPASKIIVHGSLEAKKLEVTDCCPKWHSMNIL